MALSRASPRTISSRPSRRRSGPVMKTGPGPSLNPPFRRGSEPVAPPWISGVRHLARRGLESLCEPFARVWIGSPPVTRPDPCSGGAIIPSTVDREYRYFKREWLGCIAPCEFCAPIPRSGAPHFGRSHARNKRFGHVTAPASRHALDPECHRSPFGCGSPSSSHAPAPLPR